MLLLLKLVTNVNPDSDREHFQVYIWFGKGASEVRFSSTSCGLFGYHDTSANLGFCVKYRVKVYIEYMSKNKIYPPLYLTPS